MRGTEFWNELENLELRMYRVLDQLQQVHAKIASTAQTADRLFTQLRCEDPSSFSGSSGDEARRDSLPDLHPTR
jgi:hypothetical protein